MNERKKKTSATFGKPVETRRMFYYTFFQTISPSHISYLFSPISPIVTRYHYPVSRSRSLSIFQFQLTGRLANCIHTLTQMGDGRPKSNFPQERFFFCRTNCVCSRTNDLTKKRNVIERYSFWKGPSFYFINGKYFTKDSFFLKNMRREKTRLFRTKE